MKKSLLIEIIRHIAENNYIEDSKRKAKLLDLANRIDKDSKISEITSLMEFSNEFYSIQEIRWVDSVLNIRIQ